ncbi:MAG: hypothetical protein JWQ04_1748 [Pedosphaera sp.]|nr:hypothetical protein [Pedosphaera sp.]
MRQNRRTENKTHLSPALSPLLRRVEREKKLGAFVALPF